MSDFNDTSETLTLSLSEPLSCTDETDPDIFESNSLEFLDEGF